MGQALSEPDIAVSIALGIGLAAATGFRVFLPLLVVGIAGRIGYLPLGEEFALALGYDRSCELLL
jgi:hypothetical protein